MQNLDALVTVLLYIFCVGTFLGIFTVFAVLGTRSRMRFANYLRSMNKEEQVEFSRKSWSFITISWIGFAIGFLGILFSLVSKQENLLKYFMLGLFAYIFVISILSTFVYRVPGNRR